MAYPWTLVENLKITLLNSNTAANAVACDVVSMKNFHKGWFLVHHTGTNDTDLVLTIKEATDVAAGTNQTVPAAQRIWFDVDAGTTSDTLVEQAAATGLTIDPATQAPMVAVIEWDPSDHTAGYDCVYLGDSGGHASNFCTIWFLGAMRYPQATPVSSIID